MNMKVVLAMLAAAVASFFLGWGIYGIALRSYSEASMNTFPGFMKPEEGMHMIPLIVANICFGVLITYAVWRMGATTVVAGLVPGAIIGFLMTLNFDLLMYAFTNMYFDRMYIVVDAVAAGVMGGLVGAVAAGVLGSGKKAA